MRKLVLLICLFNLQFNFAQNTYPFPASGNVGIGTTNPMTTLDVFGAARFKVPDDQSGNSWTGFSIETNSGTNLKMGGNHTYSWIQSHMSLPLYINELGNNTIFNLNAGNVGIGLITPQEKLHLLGKIKFAVNQNANDNGYYGLLESFHSSNTGVLSFVGAGGGGKVIGGENYGTETVIYSGTSEKMRVKGNGNFLVGTTTDTGQKLQVAGDISTTGFGTIGFTTDDNFSAYGGTVAHYGLTHLGNANPDILSGYFGLGLFTTGTERIRIDSSGNVGIGTTNPNNKLDVNGTIHSKEVKVDMNGWPDFVFKKEYSLPTLEEVENQIKENGHLANIPSEEEVVKNGINLGEMNAKLLQKIEELTLYSIAQQKKINTQEQEIEALKDLVLRVTKIENELSKK